MANRGPGGVLTYTEKQRLRFWTEFTRYAARKHGSLRLGKPSSRYYCHAGIRRSGFVISLNILFHRDPVGLSCELYMSHSNAKAAFEKLKLKKAAIDRELGHPRRWRKLDWLPLRNRKSCRIIQRRPAYLERMGTWPPLFDELLRRGERFQKVFGRRVRSLALT